MIVLTKNPKLRVNFALAKIAIVKRKTEVLPKISLDWKRSAKLGEKCEVLRELDRILAKIFA